MATHPLSVVTVIQANADVENILPNIKRLSSIFESMVIGEEGEMAVIGVRSSHQGADRFHVGPRENRRRVSESARREVTRPR